MVKGEIREQAILRATIALLEESGYAALTMDAVAARAGASKATLYRRWRNKAELAKAALDALDAADVAHPPDTGALRSDLLEVMIAARAKATAPYLAMVQDLMSAARHDPVLAELLAEHAADDELSPFREVLLRAVERGQIAPGVDTALVHDVAEAMIIRQLQAGAPFDDAFILRVVDGVLLPLLGAAKR